MILKDKKIISVGQFEYAFFSILFSFVQIFLFALILLSKGFWGGSSVGLTILTIVCFILQIIFSSGRLVNAGLNPVFSLLHLIPPITPFFIFYLIVKSPKKESISAQNSETFLNDSRDEGFHKQYYLWFFGVYYFIVPLLVSRHRLFQIELRHPNLIPILNLIPTIMAIIFIMVASWGIILFFKKNNIKNFSLYKILALIFCLFVLFTQGKIMEDRLFSENASLYRQIEKQYAVSYTVVGVTKQSFILDNNQEIYFMHWGDLSSAIENFSKLNQSFVGKQVRVRIPSFDEWKPNYICRERCSFPGYVYYDDQYLNTSLGFIKFKN